MRAGEDTLTDGQIAQLLWLDILDATRGAAPLVKNWITLPPLAKQVLIEMVFQMGATGVRKFRLMRAAIERCDWARAADEMLDSRWAQQTPTCARELANLMRSLAR